jgi:PKD repeat protein
MRKLIVIAVLSCLAVASNVTAATVKIGQTAPPNSGSSIGCSFCAEFQLATDAPSPSYAVPAGDGGVITSWSLVGDPNPCPGASNCSGPRGWLIVFRPTSTAGTYDYVGASDAEMPPEDGSVHTYPTSIVVKPGDVIGLDYTDIPAFLSSGDAGDLSGETAGCSSFVVGDPCTPSPTTGLLNVSAVVQTPTASFTVSASPQVNTAVNFSGAASTSAATITDYKWSFGDGQTLNSGTTATATHSYATAGNQTVTLTITDANGDTNTTSQTIDVLPAFLGSAPVGATFPTSKHGAVTIGLYCSTTAVTSCSDAVTLYGGSGALPSSAKAATSLATGNFTVASGASATEQLTLDAAGRKLIKKHKLVPGRVVITATDGAGRTVTTITLVKLKRTSAKKKKHHGVLLPAIWL